MMLRQLNHRLKNVQQYFVVSFYFQSWLWPLQWPYQASFLVQYVFGQPNCLLAQVSWRLSAISHGAEQRAMPENGLKFAVVLAQEIFYRQWKLAEQFGCYHH